jgi:hypothetical protein
MMMPIEDASVIWRSPEDRVATLRIPRQPFDTADRDALARAFTINPWHAVADHRPLGNQNRARRHVYLGLVHFACAEAMQQCPQDAPHMRVVIDDKKAKFVEIDAKHEFTQGPKISEDLAA